MQKLYCYVDETGQDVSSEFFIVVAVVSDKEQEELRNELLEIENLSKIGKRKWHKAMPKRRLKYLALVLNKKIGEGEMYFGRYKKPLPYFMPIMETIEKAIKDKAKESYEAIIHIDGIDRKKAGELTNALRLRGIKLRFVKSVRDESEPLVRLADRWAGCIRRAFKGYGEERNLLTKAKKECFIKEL